MARRDDPPVPGNSTLSFTSDGNLVLQSTQREVIATPNDTAVSASMLDTGNFVVYNSQQNITWQSFDSPTDTLLEGQYISAGRELLSAASDADNSTGIFRIKMQEDGNLVMYPINTVDAGPYAYWSSGTFGRGDTVTLNLAGDGLLYLMNGTGAYLRNLTDRGLATPNIVYRARIDPDGIFRLYSYNMTEMGNWSTVWSTTYNKCDPKGLCGFNAFCTNFDQVARCQCLPGFDFVQSGNETSGCQRSFTAESCTAINAPASYNISVVSNTVWEDDSYSVVAVQTENECRIECLQDCNCEAAYYQDGACNKQRLPLRYGRRDFESSNAVFVKVGQMTPGDRSDPQRPEGRRKERIRMDILVVSLILIAVALVIIIACGIHLYKNRVWLYKTIPTDCANGMIEDVAPRSFTYDELKKVTGDFREVIGKGAFGIVYRGTMSTGKAIAVKRLERVSTDGEREYHTEMKIIGRTHHRNLVRLLGYSFDASNRLLVYEYMSSGSLADLLFAPDKLLCWGEKMGIVRNIARGLLYLHEECETQIIHCDIKPGNILIDEQRCAKISDFGLSKLLKPDQTNTFTRIRGTRGYQHLKLA
ncbi:hypothetical protein CRG98_042351 [Punica granatum]|uniref:non-specific serine/threonine protein kinase n=1 Tax=Punica granatum TaxID=22663 RepID=A0A2I0I0I1_PUNGR|nr:hypothetical protein CRG98_042351 [Punica granatum]